MKMAAPMTSRSVLLACAIAAAIPQTALAGELRLGVGAGAAAAGYDPCSYPGSNCDTPRTRMAGPAPLVLAGYRHRFPLRHGFALRAGGMMSAVLISPAAETSTSVVSGAGEFGVQYDRFAADVIAGLSFIRMSNDEMTGRGGTMLMGGQISAKLSPELAAFGRIDLNAMMHGTVASAFIGVGLEWTP